MQFENVNLYMSAFPEILKSVLMFWHGWFVVVLYI